LRASATMAIRRTRPFAAPTRARNQRLNAESGWVTQPEPGQLDHGLAQAAIA
jgi:hypothetical protein